MKEHKDTLPAKKDELPSFKHKTLEERAAEYDRQLNLDGELAWRGTPVGKEVW